MARHVEYTVTRKGYLILNRKDGTPLSEHTDLASATAAAVADAESRGVDSQYLLHHPDEEINVRVIVQGPAPTAPGITATAVGGTSDLSIALTTPSNAATPPANYALEESTSPTGPWSPLAQGDAVIFPYLRTGLNGGAQRSYRATPTDSADPPRAGPPSAVTTATTHITTPAAFSFLDVTGAAVATLITSQPVTITGPTTPVPISVVGGEYSIGAGAFTTAPGTVIGGNQVRLRRLSSSATSTLTQVTLTVNGVSDTWDITTAGVIVASSWWYNWPTMTLSIQQGAFGTGLGQTDSTVRLDHREQNAIMMQSFPPGSSSGANTWISGLSHLRSGNFKPKLLMYYNVNDLPISGGGLTTMNDLIDHLQWGNPNWYARRASNNAQVYTDFQLGSFLLANLACSVNGLNSINERMDQAWNRYYDLMHNFGPQKFVDNYLDGFFQDVFEQRCATSKEYLSGGGIGGDTSNALDLNNDGIAENRWDYSVGGNGQARNVSLGNIAIAEGMEGRWPGKPVMRNTARFYVDYTGAAGSRPPLPLSTNLWYHTQHLNLMESHGNNIGLARVGSGASGTYMRSFNGNLFEGARRLQVLNTTLVDDADASLSGGHAASVMHCQLHSRATNGQPNPADRLLMRFWLALALLQGRTACGVQFEGYRAAHLDEQHLRLGDPLSAQFLATINEASPTGSFTSRPANYTSGSATFHWLICAYGLVVLRTDTPPFTGTAGQSATWTTAHGSGTKAVCVLPPGPWRSPPGNYINPITNYGFRNQEPSLNNGAVKTSTDPLAQWTAQFFMRD